jgi:hypothetical protein
LNSGKLRRRRKDCTGVMWIRSIRWPHTLFHLR